MPANLVPANFPFSTQESTPPQKSSLVYVYSMVPGTVAILPERETIIASAFPSEHCSPQVNMQVLPANE